LKITGVIWLQDIVEKINSKHHVEKREVREILTRSSHFRFVERGHRSGENVYAAMGQTNAGRYLIVFFILKRNHQALVLSARNMTASERKRYEKR